MLLIRRWWQRCALLGILTLIASFLFIYSPGTKIPWRDTRQSQGDSNRSTPTVIGWPKISPSMKKILRKSVLIVAGKRTGSSFFGEFFNRNHDVFYYFEPLEIFTRLVLTGQLSPDLFDAYATDTLLRILQCDFTGIVAQWKFLRKHGCTCSKAIASTELCRKEYENSQNWTIPSSLQREILEYECHQHNIVAVKTIRIYDLNLLRFIAMNHNIDLKIIQLVRDPRAVYHSRVVLNAPNYDYQRKKTCFGEMEDYCRNVKKSITIGKSGQSWLKGHYRLVRYEDIATGKMDMMMEIYEFIGIELSRNVNGWLRSLNLLKNNTKVKGPFSTMNGADNALKLWRKQMRYQTIETLQRVCKDSMELLGYKIFDTELKLRNTKFRSF
ncbi:carbohydrate sulfotransferase 1-like [Glandiceps talaboti]